MTKTEKAIQWMENTASDNSHGYDQWYRWGEKGDYDCSAAVITAWEKAGVPVKSNGAVYTGNMYEVFIACGFEDVTKKVNLATAAGMKRGDVLLNIQRHVAMYCGGGMEVEASVNEKGGATGGQPGDQTGREFLIRPYRNFPWDKVLRYKEPGNNAASVQKPATNPLEEMEDYEAADGVDNIPKWTGRVTASMLNVRSWAGTEYPNIKSYPTLSFGNLVDVCDQINAADRSIWYFVRIAGEYYGFVSARYIVPNDK